MIDDLPAGETYFLTVSDLRFPNLFGTSASIYNNSTQVDVSLYYAPNGRSPNQGISSRTTQNGQRDDIISKTLHETDAATNNRTLELKADDIVTAWYATEDLLVLELADEARGNLEALSSSNIGKRSSEA